MSNILITGGAGFIPSSLADVLSKNKNYNIVFVDNFLTGNKRKITKAPNVKFIKCDVNNYKDISPIMTSYRFDYVFHYAAVVGVKRTLANPVMVLDDIQGIKNILDLSKNTGVKRVFYSSSSEVYGEPVELPQNEHTTPLNSRLPYAIVKNVGEAFCKSYHVEFNLDYTIFRFFNTYGPKQSTDFVISKFLRAALSNHDITIYGDGSQTRSFCFVSDLINGLTSLFFTDSIHQPINIGNPRPITMLELASEVIRLTNSKSEIIFLPLPSDDPRDREPDITKAKEFLKWEPKVSREDGLIQTIEDVRRQLSFK